jgi:hypothetical protein
MVLVDLQMQFDFWEVIRVQNLASRIHKISKLLIDYASQQVGGSETLRKYWFRYKDGCAGLVFVVDGSSRNAVEEAAPVFQEFVVSCFRGFML